jgi:hypothetical protein
MIRHEVMRARLVEDAGSAAYNAMNARPLPWYETPQRRLERARSRYEALGEDSPEAIALSQRYPLIFIAAPRCGCGYRVTDDRCCRNKPD